jgi:hypothetical protein
MRRSNPDCFRVGFLDCFASLAMTANQNTPSRPRRMSARVLRTTSRLLKIRRRSATPRGSRECRALGAPAASCAKKSTRVRNHGHAGITRHSPRNGFNGFLRALPGDRALLSPSSPRSLLLENLTPASGRQNHTTSPSAMPSAFVNAPLASTASRANVRDDRETPL